MHLGFIDSIITLTDAMPCDELDSEHDLFLIYIPFYFSKCLVDTLKNLFSKTVHSSYP